LRVNAARPEPTVVVIDDDEAVCTSTARLLQSAGLSVSMWDSAQAYLDHYDDERGGCLVLDMVMPGIGGLALQQVLADRGDATPIVFLTGRGDVTNIVLAMKHGALDLLTKPVDEVALLEAVHRALAKDLADRAARAAVLAVRRKLATLTPRESQVLAYVVAGKLNKQTAYDLGTVEKTIKVHRAHVMEKMQARSLAHLVQLASMAGISASMQC
jgi:FixJ family two-component response regulator